MRDVSLSNHARHCTSAAVSFFTFCLIASSVNAAFQARRLRGSSFGLPPTTEASQPPTIKKLLAKSAIQEEAELKIAVEQSVGSWFHESELAESEVSFATTSDRWHLEALDSAER